MSCASSLYGAGLTASHYAHAEVQLHHYDLRVERTPDETCSAGSCAPGPTAVLVTGGGCVVAAGRRSPFLRPCSATVTPVIARVPTFIAAGQVQPASALGRAISLRQLRRCHARGMCSRLPRLSRRCPNNSKRRNRSDFRDWPGRPANWPGASRPMRPASGDMRAEADEATACCAGHAELRDWPPR